MKTQIGSTFAVATLICAGACSSSEQVERDAVPDQPLVVSHVFAPAPAAPDVMALYFTIQNMGQDDDTLLTVQTSIAEHASVHQSVAEGGMTRMQALENLPLPAGQIVELAPGALHVMLTDLTQTVNIGDTVHVELVFSSAPPIALNIPVMSYADAAAR